MTTEPPGWQILLKILIVGPLMTGVFVVIWACLNFAWGTALDELISPAVFTEPCRRLANSDATLTRYAPRATSRRGVLIQRARCHFGAQEVVVNDRVWDREFSAREFWLLLVVNGLVLMANIAAALFCTFRLFLLMQHAFEAFARRRSLRK